MNTLKADIDYYLALTGKSKDQLALELGISRSAFYDKLKNPDKFTLGEFKSLVKTIILSPEQIEEIVCT